MGPVETSNIEQRAGTWCKGHTNAEKVTEQALAIFLDFKLPVKLLSLNLDHAKIHGRA
jgi:hypothetical protein